MRSIAWPFRSDVWVALSLSLPWSGDDRTTCAPASGSSVTLDMTHTGKADGVGSVRLMSPVQTSPGRAAGNETGLWGSVPVVAVRLAEGKSGCATLKWAIRSG